MKGLKPESPASSSMVTIGYRVQPCRSYQCNYGIILPVPYYIKNCKYLVLWFKYGLLPSRPDPTLEVITGQTQKVSENYEM
jgi:hypothetical protein